MIKEAEINAQKLVEEAANKVRRMASEYQDLKKQVDVYRVRMRTLVQAQLEILGESGEDE